MPDWNPARHRRSEGERTRPAQALPARVRLPEAAPVVDLGSGPRYSTERLPQPRFAPGDSAAWAPPCGAEAPERIDANAFLQWLPEHAALIPRLFAVARKAA